MLTRRGLFWWCCAVAGAAVVPRLPKRDRFSFARVMRDVPMPTEAWNCVELESSHMMTAEEADYIDWRTS